MPGRNGRSGRRHVASTSRPVRFVGREATMADTVFTYNGERNSEMYIRNIKNIQAYVGKNFHHYVPELCTSVGTLVLADPVEPPLADVPTAKELNKWNIEYKEYIRKMENYRNFRGALYNLVLGQCAPEMQSKMKAHPDFAAAHQNGLLLLSIIRRLLHTFEANRLDADAYCETARAFWSITQGAEESTQKYYERFEEMIHVIDELRLGSLLVANPLAEKYAAEDAAGGAAVPAPSAAQRLRARNSLIANNFIRGASVRDPRYLDHLQDSFLDGVNIYPSDLDGALDKLINRSNRGAALPAVGETAFAQTGTTRDYSHIRCYNCQQFGHYADHCPEGTDSSRASSTTSAAAPPG